MLEVLNNSITAPVREITTRVRIYNGDTLTYTLFGTDKVKSVEIERVAESGKFFGFGIIQKATIKLLDNFRVLNITTDNSLKVYFKTTENGYTDNFPTFYVSEVHRDENTNELSITAYDALKKAEEHTVNEMDVSGTAPGNYLTSATEVLGITPGYVSVNVENDDAAVTKHYDIVNLEGTENIRELLNAIAEVTQTIYYLDRYNLLTIKRLSTDDAVLTIDKSQYFTLESSTNRRLTAITHETELGDNVTAELGITGTTQVIRDNPFWNLSDDIDTHLTDALNTVGGITINQFNCKWRGNYLLEIGDKIALVTKDNATVTSYLLDDVITYTGDFTEVTQWKYNGSDTGESNPVTLGEALKQTYAKVDKVNKKVDIVASDLESFAGISVEVDKITQTVKDLEDNTNSTLDGVNEDIAELKTKASTILTKDDYTVVIDEYITENGVEQVITSNGYEFSKDGLLIDEKDADGNRISATATKINHNGMKVLDEENNEVLSATNWGVDAKNLRATTYLIIGTKSRFEDFEDGTGCFWVGGA